MAEIPEFEEAVSDFRRFLTSQGQANDIVWVFRDDLWFRGPDDIFMRFAPPEVNESLAMKVYDEGRGYGLVEITAVANANEYVAATVWFPKFPEEVVQG